MRKRTLEQPLRLICLISYIGLSRSHDWSTFDIMDGQWAQVIEKDVCIVGGGSSGVHAAVSLLDMNRTLAIIERNDRLGGHCETWTDPSSGVSVDYGVVIHQPLQAVYDFFNKFNIPLLNMSSVPWNKPGDPANTSLPAVCYNSIREDVDFRDGSSVDRGIDPGVDDAFSRLGSILSDYPYLLQGYDLPDPIPEDLIIPFGAFLEKHNLTAVIPTYYQFSQGMGNLLDIPTIYVVKYFNLGDLQALSQGYLTAANGDTSMLYRKARDYVGRPNIFLQSTVVSTKRQNTTSGNLELLISTKGEGLQLLSCKQALLTIPPTLLNLGGWDLSAEEYAVFSQYVNANGYWTGLVTDVGLSQTTTYWNAAAATPFQIPVLPGLYVLTPVGVVDNVWAVKFGSNTADLSDDLVQEYIQAQIRTLRSVNNVTTSAKEPKFLAFSSHTPFQLQVPPEAIWDGFFGNLTALQGGFGGRMFYSGAAFHTPYSALLWRFNEEVVLPLMMQ
ncbi:uncharacterized protein F4807DRAFT_177693 [Annulohypoxylon truncatum]|uniref:uncharacterized protein n=1 Tax=Annulohypoxylon truncatum TaxID=327061 RepID=UPI002007FD18|nr:uncharacterized protein F4807DRAFT_177693 [Annulohypoxylon truncatum]KAI1207431.1 hypothetical protein F4807DRAFT_177693 [Annulohypoxylon truncatum]